MTADSVQIVEVGPRDGLQAEKGFVPTDVKVGLIERLIEAGLRRIEATSMVSASAVPQLADATDVLYRIPRRGDVEISVLVPNERGMERALAARVDRVAVFTSASETFAQRNIRCSIDESITRFEPVVDAASAADILVRAYVSMAWHCPYEGAIAPKTVVDLARRLYALGCDELAIADTVGMAEPSEVSNLLRVLAVEVPIRQVAVHFHDTRGRAASNVEAALETGVRIFDAAVGGLGGCPFAPGSSGNLSTAKLVTALERHGMATGVDLDKLRSTEHAVKTHFREAA